MRGRFRLPMLAFAAALLGLIAVLATLQYRWLGRISDAERQQTTSTLNTRAAAFAQDFDRELTLAYSLFQFEPIVGPMGALSDETLPTRLAARYDRWQTLARHPRLIKEYYVAARDDTGPVRLQRFNTASRLVEPAEWPSSLGEVRAQIVEGAVEKPASDSLIVRTITGSLWETIPALVVPSVPAPLLFLDSQQHNARFSITPVEPSVAFTILVLDRDYIARDMLPALAADHFRGIGDGFDYQLAVVSTAGTGVVYQSTSAFEAKLATRADATADLFQLRPQEFAQLTADVRRFTLGHTPGAKHTITTFTAPVGNGTLPRDERRQLIIRGKEQASAPGAPSTARRDRAVYTAVAGAIARHSAARWRLLVKHPSGSLEAAVNSARRRNLLISTSILGVLAASLVMIVVSTRRSQELARQQMEFVAAVSHELRTPLAVSRSAGDNLADGVVHDDAHIRKYGALVRDEGRRLTEMVEQILEFSGIHSGQRTLNVAPVHIRELIDGVLGASDALIDAAGLQVNVTIPPDLPPVAGDEAGLRRVFQNLIGNAIKYGAGGGWIGISARHAGSEVRVSIIDRGMGIAPADQARIFEPFYRAADVVSAQIQGAGLGLSLVHRLVEAHRGRITVKSAKGSGSEFTVHLPAATGLQAKLAGHEPGVIPYQPTTTG